MHSLSIEYSKQFVEYLEIVNKKILTIKMEAQEKMKRKALFNCGISFFGEEDDDSAKSHPDELKKQGMEKFKMKGLKIEVKEMNLDQKLLKEQQAKKEEALRRMNEGESARSAESTTADEKPAELVATNEEKSQPKKDKKKKNKKKKNKGLADFMEDKNEASAFNKENEGIGESVKIKEVAAEPEEKVPTVEMPPAEEEATPTRSAKKPSILMKANETSEQKSQVCFDESQNNVVEFAKNEKIKSGFAKIETLDDDEIQLRGSAKSQKKENDAENEADNSKENMSNLANKKAEE